VTAHPSVGLVTDSTADLPDSLNRDVMLEVVPLVVSWDQATYRDKVDLSTEQFYARLSTSKSLPKTGAPSIAAFEDAYRKQLATFAQVVSIDLSAGFSTTVNVARQAAAAVDPTRVSVVDAGTVTRCLGWIVEEAARLAASGASATEIIDAVERLRPRVRLFAILSTLEFLQRGGRIGRAAALAGTLLNVKPILEVRDGEVRPVERVRTLNGAVRRLVELVVSAGPVERLAVMHGAAASSAVQLEQQLQPHFPQLHIEHGEIGAVLGVHAGPGVFGAAMLLAQ
jgi:DegV family protein with EDD domain